MPYRPEDIDALTSQPAAPAARHSAESVAALLGEAPRPAAPGLLSRAARYVGETAADDVTAAVPSLLDPVKSAIGALGSYVVPYTGSGTLGERFRNEMAQRRAEREQARQRSPITTPAASVAGMLAIPAAGLGPMSARAAGLALPARMVAGAGDAALLTGASAAAEHIDQNPLQAGAQAATNPVNLALGAAAPAVAEAIPAVAGAVGGRLKDIAITQGRKALTGRATISARKPLAEEAVQQAIETGAIRPLGTVQGAAGRLDAQTEALGERYNQIVRELEARGVTGPAVKRLADQLIAEADATAARTLMSPKPDLYRDAALELAGGTKAGMHGATVVPPKPTRVKGFLDLSQAEDMKRSLQAQARSTYDKLTNKMTPTGEAQQDLASTMRQAIEDAVTAQAAKAPLEAAAFEPVKKTLSNAIAARNAAREASARAAAHQSVGLKDAMAAAAVLPAGGPIAALEAGLASKLIHSRGPSTAAWAAYRAAQPLDLIAGGRALTEEQLRALALARLLRGDTAGQLSLADTGGQLSLPPGGNR